MKVKTLLSVILITSIILSGCSGKPTNTENLTTSGSIPFSSAPTKDKVSKYLVGEWTGEAHLAVPAAPAEPQPYELVLGFTENNELLLSSKTAPYYGAPIKEYNLEDDGSVSVTIPCPIPAMEKYIPYAERDLYKIQLNLTLTADDTLEGKVQQDTNSWNITFKKIANAPRLYVETDTMTVEQMREDAEVVFDILENKHINAFYVQSKQNYEKRKEELLAKLDGLDVEEFYYEINGLISSIMDGHTAISQTPSLAKKAEFLPLQVDILSGKWYLIGVAGENEKHLFKEITAINDIPMEEVGDLIATTFGHENDAVKNQGIKYKFANASLLKYLGIIDDVAILTLDGKEKVTFTPVNSNDALNIEPILRTKKPETAPQTDKNYWYKALNDDVFYVQYNSCVKSAPPMEQFGKEVEKALTDHKYKKIIIDLRNNGGGNSYLMSHFYNPIKKARDDSAEVFCLIGKITFSAAFTNAFELKQDGVTLVGQPTGGNMIQFTEINYFDLPNSRFRGQYSTRFSEYGESPVYDSLYPDITVDTTIDDYKNGIDPEIDYIILKSERAE